MQFYHQFHFNSTFLLSTFHMTFGVRFFKKIQDWILKSEESENGFYVSLQFNSLPPRRNVILKIINIELLNHLTFAM